MNLNEKRRYQDIMARAKAMLDEQLMALQQAVSCHVCAEYSPALFEPLHLGCAYQQWLDACVHHIEHTVAKGILERVNQIQAYRETFSCHSCAACCRFASSEFSYETLREKAKAGDVFAREFTSVFLPYESTKVARARFPELVDSVLDTMDAGAEVYFYHCPYVMENNLCGVYGTEKRPALCERYPDTPLTFIHKRCSWHEWKESTHDDTLIAHASIELCHHYLEKLAQLQT